MASMVWNETLSVGVKALDDDHKKLVDMIHEVEQGKRPMTDDNLLELIPR